MEESSEDTGEEQGGRGISLEVVRSYYEFAGRVLKSRKLLVAGTLALGLALTLALVKFIPRTYSCTTVLMTVQNRVLDSDRGPRPLSGAHGLIMRHENLEDIIKDTKLKQTYHERRPPLLKLKDSLIRRLAGSMDDKDFTSVLIGTLENKLTVEIDEDTLSISVDWTDGQTAAEIAEATKDRFLQVRHKTEISAFQEKMAILNLHANKLREEIDSLAAQMKATSKKNAEERAAKLGKDGAGPGTSMPASSPIRLMPKKPAPDEQLPDLRERLGTLKQKLTAADAERSGRIREEQGKLAELKLRFTASHPQVITQEERLGVVSQLPSELALLRSEVADLESQVRQREAMAATGTATTGRGTSGDATAAAAPLPADILTLLDDQDADVALSAQMSGAVVRYASLRDDVRGSKLALDTEQAAFNHRYQVVIPVEQPGSPSKPKVLVIFAAGLVLSLLLALLLPFLLELRRGMLTERWQVDHFQLPVLAELRLPEKRGE